MRKPDLLICGGDFTIFGRNISSVAKKFNSFNIPLLIIPGNHETLEEVEEICKKNKNLINIHNKMYEFQGFQFFGYGLGGFAKKDPAFEKSFSKIKSKIKDNKKFIVITHQPPYKTNLDDIDGDYVGSISIRKFIELTKPVLAISGHIHETFHNEDKIKETRIINPGDGEFVTL